MANASRWARLMAARITNGPEPEPAATGPEQPLWARIAAARATGRPVDAQALREARAGKPAPRKEWERKLLARLGHDSGPGAA
ncbi:hypothetical protein [Streptomyces antibioticus]|uniref:hypothetical protein n=1 Tax=Streptomyces antibioticus TaxID=1890 RepID=UPI0036D7D274